MNLKQRNTTMTNKKAKVCGRTIQHDASGQGHCWRTVSANDLSADTVEDIHACILDGESHCELHIADGGEHYRW
jgi:hypothetical protein